MDEALIFNGLDGDTGDYLFAPARADRFRPGLPPEASHLADLNWRRNREKDHLGVIEGVDPMDLRQSGWGVIFARHAEPSIKEALLPLLRLREQQAGERYREFSGNDAPSVQESKREFLGRHNAGGGGPVDPSRIPYYLLIVGSPEAIPFEFQYQLDVQYAVGRIWFDTLQEYAQYAASVVAADTGQTTVPRQACFFGTANDGDLATELSASQLVSPLAEHFRKDHGGWQVQTVLADEATRDRLLRLAGGEETPAFLFTATHGMGFRSGHALQQSHGGALVCQDWPGPGTRGSMRDYYLAAEDLRPDAKLAGTIVMLFACFGAGTPRRDDFAPAKRAELAPQSFLGALPARMLGHPNGGALAVIGHVDRAWECSFRWEGADPQVQTFQSTIQRLLNGQRVGWALEYFNSRYAELSSDLLPVIEEAGDGRQLNQAEIRMVTSQRDARNYAVIGDPAVRLRTAEPNTAPLPEVAGAVPEIRTAPPAAPELTRHTAAEDIRVTTWHGDRRIATTMLSEAGAGELRIDASVSPGDMAYLQLHQSTVQQAVALRQKRRTDQDT